MEPLINLDDEELKAREDYKNISSVKNGVSLAQYMYTLKGYHKENVTLVESKINSYSYLYV